MKKNEIHTGIVSDFGYEGEGIIKTEDYVVFLPFAVPGEKVRYKVLKVAKNLVYGKVEEVLTPAEARVRPNCPVFTKCGGCSLMHLSYKKQLLLKRDIVSNCLKKIAFIDITPQNTVPSKPEFNYRVKLQLPIRQGINGIEVGFFATNSHRLVPINNCVIHGEWCEGVIKAIKRYAEEKHISAYDESTGKGLLRHLVVKKAGKQFIVVLVVNGKKIPHINYFDQLISQALKAEYSLFVNVNERNDNVILGSDYVKISGKGFISDTFSGINYTVGPESFIQVNEYVKGRLYGTAVELATKEFSDSENKLNVIDAYCGAGLLTAMLAQKCEKVTGVEIVPEAIENAKRLAIENQIENAKFICSPCEEALPDLINQTDKNSVLVLDPPRKGIDKKIIQAIIKARPRRIVYVSCSPQTFSRDIGLIGGTLEFDESKIIKTGALPSVTPEGIILPSGYTIKYLRGFDMFAQCKGIEVLCSLELDNN